MSLAYYRHTTPPSLTLPSPEHAPEPHAAVMTRLRAIVTLVACIFPPYLRAHFPAAEIGSGGEVGRIHDAE